jgi:NifB/MoaA-like Fe-S oxidoreductase
MMEHNKAPRPDGFPAEFYQTFRDIIRVDLLAMFSLLHAGQLELFHFNLGEIILLPKVNEVDRIQQTIQSLER